MRTPQEPLGSGFRAASTTNDVIQGIDLSGKTAIVTGGYAASDLKPLARSSQPEPELSCRPAIWRRLGTH
jgi:hypothetical protein